MDTLALKPITVACLNGLIASVCTHEEGGFSDEEIADLLQFHMIDTIGNPYLEMDSEYAAEERPPAS